jgi:hypothetical protein
MVGHDAVGKDPDAIKSLINPHDPDELFFLIGLENHPSVHHTTDAVEKLGAVGKPLEAAGRAIHGGRKTQNTFQINIFFNNLSEHLLFTGQSFGSQSQAS